MKKRCLIVAMAEGSHIIGDGKTISDWDLRDDRIFFSKMTTGQETIMGRSTYESLPDGYRPLPKRRNIVLTKNPIWTSENPEEDGVIVCHCPWQALEKAEAGPGEKIFVIGGGIVYDIYFNSIVFDEIYITTVFGEFTGSVYFPPFPLSFSVAYRHLGEKNFLAQPGRNSHPFSIQSYVKK